MDSDDKDIVFLMGVYYLCESYRHQVWMDFDDKSLFFLNGCLLFLSNPSTPALDLSFRLSDAWI